MLKEDLIKLGSQTAKAGFKTKQMIIDKFNNRKINTLAQAWLLNMGYNLAVIENIIAVKVKGSQKADLQVQIKIILTFKTEIDCQNISVKLISNPNGYNQIDKRWLTKYQDLWHIPNDILEILKLYTGETTPYINNPRDLRRMFANELSEKEQTLVLDFLQNNKTLIISDLIKGRGSFSAEWMLVIYKTSFEKYSLQPINFVLNYYAQGKVEITKQGNFRIGRVTMQRKGGDNGRKTANMLQFKINPALLIS